MFNKFMCKFCGIKILELSKFVNVKNIYITNIERFNKLLI